MGVAMSIGGLVLLCLLGYIGYKFMFGNELAVVDAQVEEISVEEKIAIAVEAALADAESAAVVAAAEAKVKQEEIMRTGIRESLAMKYGTVNQTVGLAEKPPIDWQRSPLDPNLQFPVHQDNKDLIIGTQQEPPMFVDPKPGHKWVPVRDPKAAPADWRGAVIDTGSVWGIIPEVL